MTAKRDTYGKLRFLVLINRETVPVRCWMVSCKFLFDRIEKMNLAYKHFLTRGIRAGVVPEAV